MTTQISISRSIIFTVAFGLLGKPATAQYVRQLDDGAHRGAQVDVICERAVSTWDDGLSAVRRGAVATPMDGSGVALRSSRASINHAVGLDTH